MIKKVVAWTVLSVTGLVVLAGVIGCCILCPGFMLALGAGAAAVLLGIAAAWALVTVSS